MKSANGAAMVLFLGGLLSGCVSSPPPGGNQSVAIEDVIGEIQQALMDVQTTLASKTFPPLKEVKLTLQTVAAQKGGGTLKLWVVSLGATTEKTKTQQIVLTLVPPPAGHPKLVGEVSLTNDLEAAILSAAEGVQKAREGKIPLVASALDVEINFTVRNSGTGGANVAIAPVTADVGGAVDTSSVQTIKVSFAVK